MKHAAIGPIATYLPERIETNDELAAEFPRWDLDLIFSKTGIGARHIAAEGECASDLGVAAAKRLFEEYNIDPASIDFLLFCTQTPDYPLPTTACLMQERLGLRNGCGAIDFNQGCSGYVYGLALADGLIRTGAVNRILFITSETYSRYIDREDRSLRTIFGDGAAATLIEASETQCISAFQFGTDGTGADTLMVAEGGARPAADAIVPRHRQRWKSSLYMDGPALINFAMVSIPDLVDDILRDAKLARDEVDLFLFHQATLKMLQQLQERLEIGNPQMPVRLERCGNTVSSTIPILINDLRQEGLIKPKSRNMLIGFGVGWSWAGCMWQETWTGV